MDPEDYTNPYSQLPLGAQPMAPLPFGQATAMGNPTRDRAIADRIGPGVYGQKPVAPDMDAPLAGLEPNYSMAEVARIMAEIEQSNMPELAGEFAYAVQEGDYRTASRILDATGVRAPSAMDVAEMAPRTPLLDRVGEVLDDPRRVPAGSDFIGPPEAPPEPSAMELDVPALTGPAGGPVPQAAPDGPSTEAPGLREATVTDLRSGDRLLAAGASAGRTAGQTAGQAAEAGISDVEDARPLLQRLLRPLDGDERQARSQALMAAGHAMATTPGNFLTGLSTGLKEGSDAYWGAHATDEERELRMAEEDRKDARLAMERQMMDLRMQEAAAERTGDARAELEAQLRMRRLQLEIDELENPSPYIPDAARDLLAYTELARALGQPLDQLLEGVGRMERTVNPDEDPLAGLMGG